MKEGIGLAPIQLPQTTAGLGIPVQYLRRAVIRSSVIDLGPAPRPRPMLSLVSIDLPPGTTASRMARTSPNAATWSEWVPLGSAPGAPVEVLRYYQEEWTLTTIDGHVTPTVSDPTFEPVGNVWQEMLGRLTDAYQRAAHSRLARLILLAAEQIQELRDSLDEIRRQRDIDAAKGAALDRAGYNVQQFRGSLNDDVYRLTIKSKIARNRSTGDVETVIEVLATTLSISPSDVLVEEMWAQGEPAAINIQVPTAALNLIGLTGRQFGQLVQRVVAAGVRAQVFLEGTFSFSSNPADVELDPDQGFAPLDQSTGGQLGYVYDPAESPDLPV